jgi:internalin A
VFEIDSVHVRIAAEKKQQTGQLDLSRLTLKTLPESISKLHYLKVLRLDNNLLASLPAWISKLTDLRELFVDANNLTSLTPRVGSLERLRVLSLAGNRLNSLPDSIGRLDRLVQLSLTDNAFTEITSWIFTLVSLEVLSIGSELTTIPDGIARLNNLKVLDLSDNPLSNLPASIGALRNLEELNISHSREGALESLPEDIRDLHSLRKLFLHGQPKLRLPPEVLGPTRSDVTVQRPAANPETLFDYYTLVSGKGAQSRPLNEAKMILVGRGGVGKTSLVRRLRYGTFSRYEVKTDGIAITPWFITVDGDQVRLNIWDFGGQEIMHSTHQFFLTKRSLYLLVLDAREGEQDANIEYWLRLVQSFGGDSPVLVAINKTKGNPFDLNRRGLKDKFPMIRDFIQTDCEANIGLMELHKAIVRETDSLEHLRDPFPLSWFTVKNRLADLRNTEHADFIRFARYQALCLEHNIEEPVSQETLVSFLHDLGIVVNFRDDPRLSETHVLNPEWVTNGIYKILNAETVSRKRGELELHDLTTVLDPIRYPRQMHIFLLDLMRKFELCYQFYESDSCYFVPELLGKDEPELPVLPRAEALHFEYHYNILPEGLLPRFIVRSRALNRDQARWRTGVVLKWDGNTAIVKADTQDRRVSIVVFGPQDGRRRLLAVIRADFAHIHQSIAKLEAKEMVPVPGYEELTVSYKTLCVLETNGESDLTLVYASQMLKIKIKVLLDGVEESRAREAIRTQSAPRSVRVAFSYSHKDEELRDRLETHLKFLQRQGFIATWHDRKIMAGDTWKDAIDDNFKRADLILLLVSADFIASDYCYQIEMRTALEREVRRETAVIPVILRACNWENAPFGKLRALPNDGKAVTSWANQDEAWSDVSAGIQKVVEDLRRNEQRLV